MLNVMAGALAVSFQQPSGKSSNLRFAERQELITNYTFTALFKQDASDGQHQTVLHVPADTIAEHTEADNTAPREILLSVDKGPSTMPTDLAIHDASLHYWSLGKALDLAKTKAQELHLDQVASDIETWVKAHPWKASFYAASAISLFAPEILSLPALEALGFGAIGVRAGES